MNRGTVQQFITECRYLKNVPKKNVTLKHRMYKQAFKYFAGAFESGETIVQRIGELRECGVKADSVNSWVRVLSDTSPRPSRTRCHCKVPGGASTIPPLTCRRNALAPQFRRSK